MDINEFRPETIEIGSNSLVQPDPNVFNAQRHDKRKRSILINYPADQAHYQGMAPLHFPGGEAQHLNTNMTLGQEPIRFDNQIETTTKTRNSPNNNDYRATNSNKVNITVLNTTQTSNDQKCKVIAKQDEQTIGAEVKPNFKVNNSVINSGSASKQPSQMEVHHPQTSSLP